jgi:integral membrane protein
MQAAAPRLDGLEAAVVADCPPMVRSVRRLRLVGLFEAASFLILLGVAMPLKHVAGLPGPVKVVGWVHGLLFLVYLQALLSAHADRGWPLKRTALLFIAAVVPAGPLFFEKSLRREERGSVEAAIPERGVSV